MSNNFDEFLDRVEQGEKERTENPPLRRTSSGSGDHPPEHVDECEPQIDPKMGSTSDDAERRWASDDTKFWACKTTYDRLPPGLYRPSFSSSIGYYLEKQDIDTDDLLILPDTASFRVLEEIEKFWALKDKFITGGFIHKRGILLWGNPGSGKTSTIQLLLKSIIKEKNGIAVFANHPGVTSNCLQMIRRIEPERPMVVIFEDLDALVETYGESEYLALLDGESQVSNVVFVATTNYPEKLDKRFVDRPSRFDTIELIPMPGDDARKLYLETKEPTLKGNELSQWVKLSKGFSVAHLKEMIISNRYYGKPIEEVVSRLKRMNKKQLTSDDAIENQNNFGFITPESCDDDEAA